MLAYSTQQRWQSRPGSPKMTEDRLRPNIIKATFISIPVLSAASGNSSASFSVVDRAFYPPRNQRQKPCQSATCSELNPGLYCLVPGFDSGRCTCLPRYMIIYEALRHRTSSTGQRLRPYQWEIKSGVPIPLLRVSERSRSKPFLVSSYKPLFIPFQRSDELRLRTTT